ncbi:MAG: P-type conjugative transfer ATPase TrbB [Alphaproteobacteria bacterium HGW-Alphaproteobacteria-18]|nr:MAG: P-type conjugative transfer ATPase TrbB [Alphaproteobacteria bacterium HGW-Alphaproteobacteria-18]
MDHPADTSAQRRQAMLVTAFCPVVRAALQNDATLEVMANPDGSVWIEEAGRGVIPTGHVLSEGDRERVIRLIASGLGSPVSQKSAIVSAELPGTGERFEGILPPVSAAPCYAIRKLARTPFTLADYVRQGALSPALAEELKALVTERANIVIAGGTSSGKTSLANALLGEGGFCGERIVLLEDTRELTCPAANIVALRTHGTSVTLRDLVRSTLRLRPDRILVGEVRGAEALDLLKAWNTGHPGGLTTLHANSASGALRRLEQLTAEATLEPPRELIGEAVDAVVFMSRTGGARRVDETLRVTGFDGRHYVTEPLSAPKPTLVRHGEMT